MVTTRYPAYEERDGPRPVRLDRTEGHVIIEGRTYPAKEIVEALAQSGYVELRAMGDSLVLGRKTISPIFKSRQERAMAALCHGSLAYCCPLSKRCAERDRALEILGLTKEDYRNLKGDSHMRFIDLAKGLGHDGDGMTYGPRARLANRPAVDMGYGADDYRRDFDALDRVLQESRGTDHHGRRDWQRDTSGRGFDSGRPAVFEDTGRGPPRRGGAETLADGTSPASCRTRASDTVEGLGALFQQGELSPFKSDGTEDGEGAGFCFSCGRTISRNVRRCPYCGAAQ